MKRIDPLGILILAITFIVALTMLFTVGAYSEGNVGFNYNRAINDASWGVIGDYEYDAGAFDAEIEGNLQSGDVYKGKTDLSITFDVSAIGVRLYSNNTLKGYTLDGLGRTNDIGAALVVPTGNLEIAIGIFGRSGNPFAPRTAEGVLTDAGFSEEALSGLDLAGLTLSEGISIKEGSSVNASLETAFDVNRFEVEVKGLLELLGEGQKTHQLLTNIATDGDLIGGLNWQASVDVAAQLFGDEIQYETAWFLGLGYKF